MATTLALAMRASMSATGVVSGANQAAGAMDRLGQQAQRTAKDVSVLKNLAIGGALLKGISAASSMFASASRSALGYAMQVGAAVDATNDLAERVGWSVESLQALQMAAKLSGVDDATGAVQKLTVAIGSAAESGNTEAFTRLGIDFEKLRAASPEEQFKQVQAAIAGLGTPAEQAAAAVSIFGKAGVSLLPLMTKNLDDVEQRMRRLGSIISSDQVQAIASMNDVLDELKATLMGIAGQVLGNLAGIVADMTNDFLAFVEGIEGLDGAAGGTAIADAITKTMLEGASAFISGVEFVANAAIKFGEVLASVVAKFGPSFGIQVDSGASARVRELEQQLYAAENSRDPLTRLMTGQTVEQQDADIANLRRALASSRKAASAESPVSVADSMRAGVASAMQSARNATNAAQEKFANRNTPEAKAKREADKAAKDAERKAAAEAARAADKAQKDAKAAEEKAKKDAEDEKRRQETAAREAERITERAADKERQIADIVDERTAAMSGKSNESLRANDVRSSEGMAQYLALATGREDPAIEEYRKQTKKLDELKAELRALQQQGVEILGAAA